MNLGLLIPAQIRFDANGRMVVLDPAELAQWGPDSIRGFYGAVPDGVMPLDPSNPFLDPFYEAGLAVQQERIADVSTIAPIEPWKNPLEDIRVPPPANEYNVSLIQIARIAQGAVRQKSTSWGESSSTVYDANGSAAPPWEVMPPNGRPFTYQQSVACPALGTNDFAVIRFVVPTGWKAAIRSIANVYAAAGFVEGSGDLIWRIDVDGVYLPGFDNITTTRGTVAQPRRLEGAILASSNEQVTYSVSVSATASVPVGAGNNIVCAIEGWFYPEA